MNTTSVSHHCVERESEGKKPVFLQKILIVGTILSVVFAYQAQRLYETGLLAIPSSFFFVVGGFMVVFVYMSMCVRSAKLKLSRPDVFLLGWLLVVLLVSLFTPSGALSQVLLSWLHLATAVAVSMTLATILSWRLVKFLLNSHVFIGVITSVLGIIQVMEYYGILGSDLSTVLGLRFVFRQGLFKPSTVFAEPTFFAFFLMGTAIISLYLGFFSGKRRYHLALLLCVAMLPLTNTPVAWFWLICIAVVYWHMASYRDKWRFLQGAIILGGVGVLGGILLLSSQPPNSLTSAPAINWTTSLFYRGVLSSLALRWHRIQEGLILWTHYPSLGVGLGGFRYFVSTLDLPHVETFLSVSAYVVILIETGIMGLFSFLAFIICLDRPMHSTAASSRMLKSRQIEYEQLVKIIVRSLLWVNWLELVFQGTLLHPRLWLAVGMGLFVAREHISLNKT